MNFQYVVASTTEDFETGRKLFREYAASLAIDLCFQNFDTELQEIAKQYNRPGGALIIVFADKKPVGCAGVRRIDDTTAELKRMYVLPEFRGHQVGKSLLLRCLDLAEELGYERIRLDTLPTMQKAQELYRAAGFVTIDPYRHNPVQGTIYMEKQFRKS